MLERPAFVPPDSTESPAQVPAIPLKDLPGLSTRTKNILTSVGLTNLSRIAELPPSEILSIRQLGLGGFDEILAAGRQFIPAWALPPEPMVKEWWKRMPPPSLADTLRTLRVRLNAAAQSNLLEMTAGGADVDDLRRMSAVDLFKIGVGSAMAILDALYPPIPRPQGVSEKTETSLPPFRVDLSLPPGIDYPFPNELECLPLTNRVRHGLIRNGIRTVGELLVTPDEKILDVWALGASALEKIRKRFKRFERNKRLIDLLISGQTYNEAAGIIARELEESKPITRQAVSLMVKRWEKKTGKNLKAERRAHRAGQNL